MNKQYEKPILRLEYLTTDVIMVSGAEFDFNDGYLGTGGEV